MSEYEYEYENITIAHITRIDVEIGNECTMYICYRSLTKPKAYLVVIILSFLGLCVKRLA